MTGGVVSRRTATLAVAESTAPVAVATSVLRPSAGRATVADQVPALIVAAVPLTVTAVGVLCVPVTAIDGWVVSVPPAGLRIATGVPATFLRPCRTKLLAEKPPPGPGRK